jgi:hypothetical protein
VVSWAKHQRPHHNEPPSELSPPPGWPSGSAATTGQPESEVEAQNGRSPSENGRRASTIAHPGSGTRAQNGRSTSGYARARSGTRNPEPLTQIPPNPPSERGGRRSRRRNGVDPEQRMSFPTGVQP